MCRPTRPTSCASAASCARSARRRRARAARRSRRAPRPRARGRSSALRSRSRCGTGSTARHQQRDDGRQRQPRRRRRRRRVEQEARDPRWPGARDLERGDLTKFLHGCRRATASRIGDLVYGRAQVGPNAADTGYSMIAYGVGGYSWRTRSRHHRLATIGTTEYFLASASTTATYQTTANKLRFYLDLSAMAPATSSASASTRRSTAAPRRRSTKRYVDGVQSSAVGVAGRLGQRGLGGLAQEDRRHRPIDRLERQEGHRRSQPAHLAGSTPAALSAQVDAAVGNGPRPLSAIAVHAGAGSPTTPAARRTR
jgi:hypothetical protein